MVCLHGGGRDILFLFGREGLILDKDPRPVPLSLETGKVSHCSLPSPPSSRPHCISHRPGEYPVLAAQDRGPSPQLARNLLASSALVPPPSLLSLPPTSSAVTAGYAGLRGPRPTSDYISQQP